RQASGAERGHAEIQHPARSRARRSRDDVSRVPQEAQGRLRPTASRPAASGSPRRRQLDQRTRATPLRALEGGKIMVRSLTICVALIAWCTAVDALAQSPPSRPPLFFSEGWQPLKTAVDDHGAWPASQAGVASSQLRLSLHGASGKEIQLVAVRGQSDLYPMNLWTGTTTSPSAASLRDKDNFVDLSDPLAKIRWTVRTSGFHQVRPIVKLADGTWLIGDHATGPSVDFNVDDVSIADMRWLKLDI